MVQIPTNEYQTPITDELLAGYPQEVVDQFLDFVNNVPFIQRLISPDRKRAKDLPRDDKGRIIVDLCNLHILEDMDYFREAALTFQKTGKYTDMKPNGNPHSDYYKWLSRERDRCWDGMVRESDGEWVTGLMYFYINYSPIIMTKINPDNPNIGDRVEDFPEIWEGVYMRFHYLEQARRGGKYNDFKGGNHAAELARRGAGKSYSLASIMGHNFLFGESRISCKRFKTSLAAYLKEYLGDKDGTISKFLPIIDFCAEHTQFPRARSKSSLEKLTWESGYIDVVTKVKKGSQNLVLGVATKDDEGKLRGKRSYILLEEFGAFPNLKQLYDTLRPGVEEGNIAFSLIYMVGTSGENYNAFAGALEIVFNPKGYNIYAIPNVFDKNSNGKQWISLFFPAYLNRKGCYNGDGVSDIVKAILEVLMYRYVIKYNSDDPTTIVRAIAEIPITPQEAVTRVGINSFPITDLNERISQLAANPRLMDDVYTGDLAMNGSEVIFVPTDKKPIRDFPHKNNKIEGCIEIFEMPKKDSSNHIPSNRYIAGNDPYDDDASNTMSLGSMFVLDIWTDRIVAEYTGRPDFAEDFYEKCRLLCLFYNAKLNYEQNKKGLYSYFARMNCSYLLCDVLEMLKEKDDNLRNAYGNKAKGTNATEPINKFARTLIKDWLRKPVPTIQVVDGTEIETTMMNLYLLRNIALMKELVNWNKDGNFDRVSALGMLMLLREDILRLTNGKPQTQKDDYDANYLGNDDFFTRNYDTKHNKYDNFLKQNT